MTSTPQPGAATDRSSRRAAVSVRRAVAALRGLRTEAGRADLLTAATALGVVLVARFALGLVALAGSALGYTVTPWPSDFTATPVGQFLGGFVLYPFPFYVVAFVVLLLVRPVDPRAALPVVLRGGIVAGAAGTVALAVVGIVPGTAASLSGGTWVNLALYVTTIPLAAGIVDTALLLVGVVLAWHVSRAAVPEADTEAGLPAEAVASTPPADPAIDVPVQHGTEEAAAAPHEEATRPLPETAPVLPRRPAASDDWSRFAPPAPPADDDGRDR